MNPQPPNQGPRSPEQRPPEPPPKGPSLISLAKTALKLFPKAGQAAKASVAKVFAGLGLKAFAGIVSGAASGGISFAVTAITTVAGFAWNNLLKPLFIKLRKEPEKIAPYLIVAGIGTLILFPGTIIGIVAGGSLIGLGGLGLFNWGTTGGGLALGSLASKVTALFTALLTLPFTAPIGLFVVSTLGVLAVLTLFIVIVASGAFILPAPEKGAISPAQQPLYAFGQPTEARDQSRDKYATDIAYIAEQVIYILRNECGITKVNRETWNGNPDENILSVPDCLNRLAERGRLTPDQVNDIVNEFHYSVFNVEGQLECVGFVRGAAKAANRPFLTRGHPPSFLSRPPPGYQNNSQLGLTMADIKEGDVVISTRGDFGHMGIVVGARIDETGNKYLLIANALGEDGTIRMEEEVALYKFDGFIRSI